MTDYKNQIEALLFASGRLMTSEMLINLTNASNKQVLLTNIDKLKKEYERITVTKAFLRVETLKKGKLSTTEIPTDELEDLVAPTTQGTINTVEVPGMKRVSIGDTGTPRMPDGRPVPGLLLSLMNMVGSKGIIARSDKAAMEFAAGLNEAEVAWLFALIRKTIVE